MHRARSIRWLGSAVALLIFSAVTIAHFRLFRTTGARLFVLIIALLTTLVTFVIFCTTTLVDEPQTALALLVVVAFAVVVDLVWKGMRTRQEQKT